MAKMVVVKLLFRRDDAYLKLWTASGKTCLLSIRKLKSRTHVKILKGDFTLPLLFALLNGCYFMMEA